MNELDAQIREVRTAQATVSLSHHGSPLSGREVSIRQTKHGFLFGANWGDSTLALFDGNLSGKEKEQAEVRNHLFLNLFNQVTLPFYWGRFEHDRGHPQTEQMMKVAHWYAENGCRIKGHPLCWHTLAPDWLLELSTGQVLKALLERIQRDVSDFTGIVDAWDVVNEAVIMPVFDRYDNGITRLCKERGRIDLIRQVFATARDANPNATLFINDFDVSPAYDILVEGLLEAGIPIDAIGIQSHMHQGYWGPERTVKVLEHFTGFGLPIHFTENTLVSGHLMPPEIVDLNDYQVDDWPSTPEGEERQACEVVMHYKTLMAQPSVQGITWWDLSDGCWLNAPSGLLRRDQTMKPAYTALAGLIKDKWWLAPEKHITDKDGKFEFAGFAGEYAGSIDGQGFSLSIDSAGPASISLEM